jgi:signal transduction histidine kinase
MRIDLLLVAATAAFCCLAQDAVAETAQSGTAEEARAMLEKAAAAVKEDKAKALAAFNRGDSVFRDRGLYVFCANAADGAQTAHPNPKGTNLKDVKDVNGFAFGQEMMKVAEDGKISEVAYMWPKPGSETPVPKVAFVTKAGDQICGVGYYK